MTEAQLQQLIKMMVERLAVESIFSSPCPEIYMQDPYNIFDWFVAENLITAIELDQLFVATQTTLSKGDNV